MALGGSEVVGALLFLLPKTSLLGSYLLLAVFAGAIAINLLHGQLDVGFLLIYSMAVIVCMTARKQAPDER